MSSKINSVIMYRVLCWPCGLMDTVWESPWFTSEREAERVKKLHDEFMGHQLEEKNSNGQ